jgi:hypothetical protein
MSPEHFVASEMQEEIVLNVFLALRQRYMILRGFRALSILTSALKEFKLQTNSLGLTAMRVHACVCACVCV